MADPQQVIRLVEEGRRLYASGHLEDAIARWRNALDIDPNAKQAQLWLRRVRGSIVEPKSLDGDMEAEGRVGDTLKGLRRINDDDDGLQYTTRGNGGVAVDVAAHPSRLLHFFGARAATDQ